MKSMSLEQLVRKAWKSGALATDGIDSLITPLPDGRIELHLRVGKTTMKMMVEGEKEDAEEATEALMKALSETLEKIGAPPMAFVHQRPADKVH